MHERSTSFSRGHTDLMGAARLPFSDRKSLEGVID